MGIEKQGFQATWTLLKPRQNRSTVGKRTRLRHTRQGTVPCRLANIGHRTEISLKHGPNFCLAKLGHGLDSLREGIHSQGGVRLPHTRLTLNELGEGSRHVPQPSARGCGDHLQQVGQFHQLKVWSPHPSNFKYCAFVLNRAVQNADLLKKPWFAEAMSEDALRHHAQRAESHLLGAAPTGKTKMTWHQGQW